MKAKYKRLAIVFVCIFIGLSFLVFVGINEAQKKHYNLRDVYDAEYVNAASLKGSGTRKSPYIIDSKEALVRFRDSVNAGYSYDGEYFIQTANIDLSTEENWIPVGEMDRDKCFSGTYDGGGHSISNLNVSAQGKNVGLFGLLGGTVTNLGIESGRIEGNCVGAIASHATGKARIINCYNKATVVGNRAGGIADNFTAGLIYNCYNEGEIISPLGGGIVGYNGTVIDCYSTTAAVFGDVFNGTYKRTQKCFKPELANEYSLGEVCEALDGNLQSISVNYLHSNSVYEWSAQDGKLSFGDKAPNMYVLYFIIGALILLGLIFAIQFFYLSNDFKYKGRSVSEFFGVKWQGFKSGVAELGYVKFTSVQLIIAAFALSFLALLLGNFASLYVLTFDDASAVFYDFYVPIKYICDNGLTVENFYSDIGENYPPIARFINWTFSLLIPTEYTEMSTFRTDITNLILLASAILLMILLYRAFERKATSRKYRMIIALCLIFCTPMMFALERANIILIALFLSAVFLLFYDSNSAVAREIALICLAFAAAIKLYPAILGVLLVHDKRYKQTIRCLIYGIVAFFGPFMFIGGIGAIQKFVNNLIHFSSNDSAGIRASCVNFSNTISNVLSFFDVPYSKSRPVSLVLLVCVAIGLFACALFINEKWKAIFAAVAMLVFIPDTAVYYMLSFYIFPLFFLLNKKKHNAFDLFYAVFLIICIMPIQFTVGIFKIPPVALWQLASSAQLVLVIGLLTDGTVQLIGYIRKKTRAASRGEALLD